MDENNIGHQYGNFHSYYKFHGADARIDALPSTLFTALANRANQVLILDVGCNEGTLSLELLQRVKSELTSSVQVHLLGIDLDEKLIERARNKCQNNISIAFEACDIMSDSADTFLQSYLTSRGATAFSITCLFSVTMWIHLNHGDDGLKRILTKVAAVTSHSLVVEPQPWKCYKVAGKRCRKLGLPTFPYPPGKLELNPQSGITHFLESQCKMVESISVKTSQWDRSVSVYRRHQIGVSPPEKFRDVPFSNQQVASDKNVVADKTRRMPAVTPSAKKPKSEASESASEATSDVVIEDAR